MAKDWPDPRLDLPPTDWRKITVSSALAALALTLLLAGLHG